MTSKGNLYTHQRGAFDVARFDNLGNAKALTRGTSDRKEIKRLSLTQAALQVGARCGVVYRSWCKIARLIMQKIIISAWLNVQLL